MSDQLNHSKYNQIGKNRGNKSKKIALLRSHAQSNRFQCNIVWCFPILLEPVTPKKNYP